MKWLNQLYIDNEDDKKIMLLPNIPSKNKIISYCLWGSTEIYNYGMLENALFAKKMFPYWMVHVYYKDNIIKSVKDALFSLKNVKMIEMKNSTNNLSNMMWRYTPAFEKDNIVIVRDADSRLTVHDYFCIKEWLKSDKDFHIIRWTNKWYKIAGGYWGSRNNILLPFQNQYKNYKSTNKFHSDTKWLQRKIYPYIKDNSFIHCDGVYGGGDKNNYPLKANNLYEGIKCNTFPKLFTEFIDITIIDENNTEYNPPITIFGNRAMLKAPLALHYLNIKDNNRILKFGRVDK